jgi:hypothetical protein
VAQLSTFDPEVIKMRMRLTCWTALSVFGIALVTSAFAQTETNQIRGRLGYPLGTLLTVEGVKLVPWKGPALVIQKVNGRLLEKPVTMELVNVQAFDVATNVACCFKGVEEMLVVPDNYSQLPKGTYYRFRVKEVITPPEVILHMPSAQESRPSDAGRLAIQPKVTPESLLDDLPDPLILCVVNTQHEAFRFSTFMASDATMPPMPNVRVEARNTSSGRIRTCTPVVLTEKRASLVLKSGEAKDIQVYHRGFVADLPEGTYAVTVSLFDDADSVQQTPIAVSRSITVKISTRERGDRAGRRSLGVEPDGAANGSQPIRSETNRTSSAAGSRR